MRGCIAAILIVLVASISIVTCNIPFQYHIESPGDPYNVAALREALMHSGVSPDGVILKSIMWKNELFRTAYKATYINGKGQSCYLKWRVGSFFGSHTPAMPICDNLSTGSGYPAPGVVIQGQPVPVVSCCPAIESDQLNGEMRVNAAILIVLAVSISVVQCNMIFQYHIESAGDPYMVAALREALMHSGISPDGVILKSIMWKNELIRTAYKATYINGKGQSCYLKWRVSTFTGSHTPAMPNCDNLSTGSGYPAPQVVIQGGIVPQQVPVVGCCRNPSNPCKRPCE
ncbi:hypothetical protein GE061_012576 [Apolygus lucorum]|uniref:Uncharacterized protein n=1 Tax=Apolygus lucorum TaxID=248454 RepID=A0A8S9XUZ8_APOLU|nr:hypothetical protein GE061_012576 [Apolygus lucorum]